jgi:hypothetical protein
VERETSNFINRKGPGTFLGLECQKAFRLMYPVYSPG